MSDDAREQRQHEIRLKVAEYAQAKAARVKLEHYRKVKKARLMKWAERELKCQTTAAQEREAYAHSDYEEVISGLEAATETETRLYWELEMLRMEFEAWRTRAANNRAERARYGA